MSKCILLGAGRVLSVTKVGIGALSVCSDLPLCKVLRWFLVGKFGGIVCLTLDISCF